MARPEMERMVQQNRADIEELYDLIAGIDRKVDALDTKLTGRMDALEGRMDALEGRMSVLEGKVDAIGGQLTEVLELLRAR